MNPPIDISELRFLVVEDHGFQRWMMCNVLEGLGARYVFSAPNGRAALEIFRDRESRIDIVVSDLDMPEMDGMELIRHLGETGGNPSLVLASDLDRSLVASVESMARAYAVRLLGAIEKPVSAKNLLPLLELHRAGPLAPALLPAFDIEEILCGLRGDQMEPFYQAKVEMGSGMVRGAEALARWRHPAHGIVGADAFIPLLERSGNIAEFTRIMVRAAAQGCWRWRSLGFDVGLSLNLSQESLADVGLAEDMTQLVIDQGVSPRDVIFEVTESAMAEDLGRALENLSRLRMKGFGLSIDDYGTGYSSMQQLTRIAFTELKIDQAFVRNAADRSSSRAVVESSLELAGKLRLATVAEGVESKPEWDLFRELGCTLAQGHFIARPMDFGDFLDWLKGRSAGAVARVQRAR